MTNGRDMLLAYLFWLADGASFFDIPMGEGVALRLSLPPMIFQAPFGIAKSPDETENADGDDAYEATDNATGDDGNDDLEQLDDDE